MPLSRNRDDAPSRSGALRFGASRRLRRPAEFAAVLAAPRERAFRGARHWLSMTAAWMPSETAAVRFGATVGKRNARRSVDRALVKRIVREASRRAASRLEALCAQRSLRLDVAFRLKASRDLRRDDQPSVAQWRRVLRAEADWLLERLARHVGEGTS